MTRSILLSLVLATVCCLFISQSTQAQYTTGISAITYDQYSQMIFTYSATDIDYYTEFYYDVYVDAVIYKDGIFATNGSDSDQNGDGIAEVYLQQTSVQSNHAYHLFSDHFVIGFYEVYDPTWGYGYWDPYGYDFLPGGTYPGGYTFFPTGQTITQYGMIYLGTTQVFLWIYPNIPGQIELLGFKGDHQIYEYASGNAIDNNDQGEPVWYRSPPESKPAAYKRGAKPKVNIWLQFNQSVPANTAVTVRAKYNNNVVATKTIYIQGFGPKISDIDFSADLETNTAQVKIGNYTLNWELTYDGQNWLSLGNSGPHKIYWTYDVPKANPFSDINNVSFPEIYDKALEIGCGKANGASTERDIAIAVNSDVAQTLKYRAVGPNVSHPLIYYSPTSLAVPSCATHANLLTGVLRSIGIEATTKYVWGGESSNDALYNYTYRNASNIPYRVSMRLIRNANIEVIDGIPTQTEEENPHFFFYAFTQAASKVYDPSYGLD